MVDQGQLVIAANVSAAVISLALAFYAHRQTGKPVASEFRNYMLTVPVWALSQAAMMLDVSPGAAVWNIGQEIGAGMVAITFIVFIAKYTQSRWLDRRSVITFMWMLFAVTISLGLTARFHGLVIPPTVDSYREYVLFVRPVDGFWLLYTVIMYGLLTAALGSLLRFLFDSTNIFRVQTGIIFGSSLAVILATIAFVSGTSLHPSMNLGPALQAPLGVAIGLAIYRYDFLTIVPLAQDTIIDTVDDPIVVLDTNGRVTYANDAAATVGITDTDHGASIQNLHPELANTLESDDATFEISGQTMRGDGGTDRTDSATDDGESPRASESFQPRWYTVSETPIADQYGVRRGRVVVCSDVTEQKRREQNLEQFANIVSHDLRNPLNVASGYVEVAREQPDTDGALDEIERSHDRMGRIIDELLVLSKHGYGEFEPTSLDLETVATEAWANVASGDSSLLEPEEDSKPILANRDQLLAILENLFRNAIEHNDRPVDIRVERTTTGFVVADDGVGIPEDERDSIFEAGVTNHASGTGYGLHIVEQFATAHGWDVHVTESTAGGAQFEFVCSA